MSKSIILCFDGMWNTPDTEEDDEDIETNVRRLYESLSDSLNV